MAKIGDQMGVLLLKIQILYDIERQLEKALPRMAKAANDDELRNGLLAHTHETKVHIERLARVFDKLRTKPKKMRSEGIRGIVADAEGVMGFGGPEHLRDAMLASASRYAEHFEMAGYMGAIADAALLEEDEIVELLEATLAEERQADAVLAAAAQRCLSSADIVTI